MVFTNSTIFIRLDCARLFLSNAESTSDSIDVSALIYDIKQLDLLTQPTIFFNLSVSWDLFSKAGMRQLERKNKRLTKINSLTHWMKFKSLFNQ